MDESSQGLNHTTTHKETSDMKKELIDKIIYSMVEGNEDFSDAFDWACDYLEIPFEEGMKLVKEEDFFKILDEVESIRFQQA
jgi:hypothetical protein